MTDNKIPLSGIGLSNLAVLRASDPPIDFADLGFAPSAQNNAPAPSSLRADTTYWQYQDWQPS